MALIVLYIGKGKGKTSACLGQVLRAKGRGYPVAFCQFIKRDGTSGEQILLRNLLGNFFRVGGLGFVRNCPNLEPHRKEAESLLCWAYGIVFSAWVLIADEILYALSFDLVKEDDVANLVAKAKEAQCHLILSGATAPNWLIEQADCVTEMIVHKHPFTDGKKALAGIDY